MSAKPGHAHAQIHGRLHCPTCEVQRRIEDDDAVTPPAYPWATSYRDPEREAAKKASKAAQLAASK